MGRGQLLALIAIYALLAVPLRSYTQPLVIMLVIPFGAVGAALGHLIMGYDLTMYSVIGLVAALGRGREREPRAGGRREPAARAPATV